MAIQLLTKELVSNVYSVEPPKYLHRQLFKIHHLKTFIDRNTVLLSIGISTKSMS